MGYRTSLARAPIDAGNPVSDNGKVDGYRYYLFCLVWLFAQGRRGVEYSHENATLFATVGVGASALTRLDSLVNSGLAIGNRFAVRVRFRAGVLDLHRLAYQLVLWERELVRDKDNLCIC